MIKKEISKIQKKLNELRLRKRKIVLCHGVFDLVHQGHIDHFKESKKFGDFLIVSITDDKFINKGPGRPLFNSSQRLDFLKQIKIIDEVILSKEESAEDVLKMVKPNFYVKGPDYKNNNNDKTKKIFLEKKLVEKFGGKVCYTSGETFSSSNLINSSNLILNNEQKKFVNKIKKKFDYKVINNFIKKFNSIRTLIIGEMIIDKYCFGSVIGKSGKEPHLVLNKRETESYLGGSAAIANHLSTFVKHVRLISPFGGEKNNQRLLILKLNKKIKFNFIKPSKSYKTIEKMRFVDEISNYKLFGAYTLPNKISGVDKKRLNTFFNKNLKKTDLIIVSDYGHDFITNDTAKKIILKKTFLSLTAQVNASNIGYHSLNKYKNIDLLVINESELRQELRDTLSNIKSLIKKLILEKKIKNIIVTRGKQGAILMNNHFKTFECPAFAKRTIDKVGAGDTMLAITSLAIKLKLDPELALFMGSLAAAKSVETIGNKESISLNQLDRTIEYLLK